MLCTKLFHIDISDPFCMMSPVSRCVWKTESHSAESKGDSGEMSFSNKMVEIRLICPLAVVKSLW